MIAIAVFAESARPKTQLLPTQINVSHAQLVSSDFFYVFCGRESFQSHRGRWQSRKTQLAFDERTVATKNRATAFPFGFSLILRIHVRNGKIYQNVVGQTSEIRLFPIYPPIRHPILFRRVKALVMHRARSRYNSQSHRKGSRTTISHRRSRIKRPVLNFW